MTNDSVLVTGGSGFVAIHCIDQLLRAGYPVRTTVRSLKREADVRAMLKTAGAPRQEALSFFEADLMQNKGWPEAVDGCKFVLHVASPFPASVPKHEDELIVPAREGALRVLRAARDAGVQRVVQTSSFAAIGYGHKPQAAPFDEATWTNVHGAGVTAYAKSKTLAERAAWDFIAREGGHLELSVINPVGIFGPALGPDYSTSILIVQKLLDGEVPACPRISFGAVDVRDVADMHLRAMTNPAANGERFLATAGEFISLLDVGTILKKNMGSMAKRVPTREMPDWIVRFLALFIADMKAISPELGIKKNASNEKAERILGWTPRSNEEAITASGTSLAQLGLLKASTTTDVYMQSLEPEVRTAINSVYAELGRTGTAGPVPDPPARKTTEADAVQQQRSARMDQKKVREGEETKKEGPTRGKLLQFAGKMRAKGLGGDLLNA